MKIIASAAAAALLLSPASALGHDTSLSPPPGWEATVSAFLEAELLDPYSAVKKVTREPRFGFVRPDAWSTWNGWAVCYSINAKNAMGGYTGAKPYLFVVSGDKVVGHLVDDGESSWFASVLRRECALPPTPPAASMPH